MKGIIQGHGDKAKYFLVDGILKREVSKEEFDAAQEAERPKAPDGTFGDSLRGFKPLASNALAVHPKQVKEARELAASRGVPTEFTVGGQPVFTSRQHRKDYMQRVRGSFDQDGGYGDASPGSFKGDRPPPQDLAKELIEYLPARITKDGQEQLVREILYGRRNP
jgi:hypothetical protein